MVNKKKWNIEWKQGNFGLTGIYLEMSWYVPSNLFKFLYIIYVITYWKYFDTTYCYLN